MPIRNESNVAFYFDTWFLFSQVYLFLEEVQWPIHSSIYPYITQYLVIRRSYPGSWSTKLEEREAAMICLMNGFREVRWRQIGGVVAEKDSNC